MIMMILAVIHVLFGQQTEQDETSLEADQDQDLSQVLSVRACTHSRILRTTLNNV